MLRQNQIIVLFVIPLVQIACGKKIFQSTTFFDDDHLDDGFVKNSKRAEERINLSVPGTKWCGPGNTAADYNDLGQESDVDMCCRDHDHCDNIPAGQTAHNLTNDDYFTRLHCNCDKQFYKCLYGINTKASNTIGYMYFYMRAKCYKEEYPIVECIGFDTKYFVRRCGRYVLDESQTKRYQWFDLPLYSTKTSSSSAMPTNWRIDNNNNNNEDFEEFWNNFVDVM